jgi:hypothetical protein
VLDLIRKLAARSDLDYVAIDKAGMRLELRRHTAAPAATSTADNRVEAVR